MTTNRYMPIKDAEFMPWAKNIQLKCADKAGLWSLPAIQVDKLNMLTESALDAYQANTNPEMANRRTSANKKLAFSELKHFLSLFTNSFYVNDAITEADFEAMGLRPRHTHASLPKPEPTEAPEVTAVIGQHHDVTVYVSKAMHGEPIHSLNSEYYGFMIRYRKAGEEEWKQQMSTKLHITLFFEPEDEATRLHFSVAWINTRLQHGPWSDEVTSLIN